MNTIKASSSSVRAATKAPVAKVVAPRLALAGAATLAGLAAAAAPVRCCGLAARAAASSITVV
jgi:hypothetical protein